MATPTPTPATPALPRPPRAPISPATWALIACIAVLGLAQIGGTNRPAGQPVVNVTINQLAPTVAPVEQPAPAVAPVEQPAPAVAPVEQPAPAVAPVAVGRPIRQWHSLAGSVIDARLVSVHGESIRLATEYRELTVELSDLSVSDHFYVSQLLEKASY